jgi:hypothetical protein
MRVETDLLMQSKIFKKAKMHPPDRIKNKNSKRSTALKVKTSSFYWSQQNGDISPIPSTCQTEGIFGLGWPDWACYFRGPPLTTGWWDPAVCHEPFVNVSNLGYDPLSTYEP